MSIKVLQNTDFAVSHSDAVKVRGGGTLTAELEKLKYGYISEVEEIKITGAGGGSNYRKAHGTHLYHSGDKITVKVSNFKGSGGSQSNTLTISLTATNDENDSTIVETILSQVDGIGNSSYVVEKTLEHDGYLYIFSRCESGREFTTLVEEVIPYTSMLSGNDIEDSLTSDSVVKALSAKQGKVLHEDLTALSGDMDDLEDVKDFFNKRETLISVVDGEYGSSDTQRLLSTNMVKAGSTIRFDVSLEGRSRAGNSTGSILFMKIIAERNTNSQSLEDIRIYPAGVNVGKEITPINETFDYITNYDGYLYIYINVQNTGVSGSTYDPANISAIRIFSTEDILDEEIKDVVDDMPIGELLDLTDLVAMNNLDLQVEDKYNGTLTYRGLKVDLRDFVQPTYHFDIEKIDITGNTVLGEIAPNKSAQGFCCYNGIGFNFYDDGYYDVIDIENHTILYSSALPDGAQKSNNHAGQAVFGTDKFDANDTFPALYVSSYQEKKTYVFRVNNDYTMTLRQNIYLTDGTQDNNQNYVLSDAQAFFVDRDRCIIKIGSGINGDYRKKWMVFDLPVLPTSNTVQDAYLVEKYKVDEFYFRSIRGKDNDSQYVFDAGFAKNGKLYLCTAKSFTNGNLVIFDYYNKKVVNDIPLSPFTTLTGVNSDDEPEECYPLDDYTLLFNSNYKYGNLGLPTNHLLKMIFGESSDS